MLKSNSVNSYSIEFSKIWLKTRNKEKYELSNFPYYSFDTKDLMNALLKQTYEETRMVNEHL